MKKVQKTNIVKRNYLKIDSAFDKVSRHFYPADIHEFRVEVKKLRAFLRLISKSSEDGNAIKLPKKLLAFYRVLGDIRSLQIQKDRVQTIIKNKYTLLPQKYLELLATKIGMHIVAAKNLAKGKIPFKRGEQRLLQKIGGKLKRREIGRFCAAKLTELEILLQPFFITDVSLHSIRKLLKDISYTSPYIRVKGSLIQPALLGAGRPDINPIINLLGDFQDVCVGLKLLEHDDRDTGLNKREVKQLINLELQWRREKESTRKEICKMLKKEIVSQKFSPLFTSRNLPQLIR